MSEWFPFQDNMGKKRKLLYCFHHAGGTASVYRSYIGASNDFTVLPVELPGKAVRIKEDFIDDMNELTNQIANAISSHSGNREIYLFGHSMGAIIAFLVATKLEKKYHRIPEALIVAGRQPPHFPNVDRYHSDMGTEELLTEMIRIDGAPEYLLESKELQNFVLPMIRRDYKLNESFQYNNEHVSCPIFAYAGSDDADALKDVMQYWADVTSGEFYLDEISGNHFFVTSEESHFFEKMENDLCRIEFMERKSAG